MPASEASLVTLRALFSRPADFAPYVSTSVSGTQSPILFLRIYWRSKTFSGRHRHLLLYRDNCSARQNRHSLGQHSAKCRPATTSTSAIVVTQTMMGLTRTTLLVPHAILSTQMCGVTKDIDGDFEFPCFLDQCQGHYSRGERRDYNLNLKSDAIKGNIII